ncbi:MAG: DUF559 domain-containing protein [Micromonosporaceae bacterium]
MPRSGELPAPLRNKCFSGRAAIERGLLSPKQLRGSAWRRLFHGVYVDSTLPETHLLRCAAALAYLLPKGSVIAGASAATLWGAGLAGPVDPVEALVPRPLRVGPSRGLRLHVGTLRPDEVVRVGRLPVTSPLRTCWDLARWLDVVEAVVLVDRVLATGRVAGIEHLLAYAQEREGERGWRRFGQVVRLADGRAESPPESRLRVRLVLAGLPVPQAQFNVYGEDGFIARVDLAWPELKLAVEYDGLDHVGSARRMNDDRRRLNRLVAAGWTVLHVTAPRLRDDLPELVAEIRATIRNRRAS